VPVVGPLKVVGAPISTGLYVMPGDTITITASGLVDFGGALFGFGAPIVGPDGDTQTSPAGYPAPDLKRHSLIARVAGIWYQAGSAATFSPTLPGTLELGANDANPVDNSRGWDVFVSHAPARQLGGAVPTGGGAVPTGGGTAHGLVPLLHVPAWIASSIPGLALIFALLALLRQRS
jgi:hypothetical protein